MYNFATGSGVSIGIIISGFIVVNNTWRTIYWVGAIMLGALLVLIIFTFPETAYNRSYSDSEDGDIFENKQNPYRLSISIILDDAEKARVAKYYEEERQTEMSSESLVIQRLEARVRRLEAVVMGKQGYSALSNGGQAKPSYWSKIRLFSGETYTDESLWKMFIRPFGLVLLPPVFWATLVMSAVIGFSVALSSACACISWPLFFDANINSCERLRPRLQLYPLPSWSRLLRQLDRRYSC